LRKKAIARGIDAMFSRRQFLGFGCGALAGMTSVRGRGDDQDHLPDGSLARGMITQAAQDAVARGLDYLAGTQHRNGSFGTNHHPDNVAITSLAALAFMAGGHQPGRGRFGRVVLNCLDFVLAQEKNDPPGFLHNPTGSYAMMTRQHDGPMYSHGFGTLFLAEVHGMVHREELRQRLHATLKRAVDLILRSQNRHGGWRYQPKPDDADISVTICQIMALRAARNAGISVPRETVDRCIQYVKSCQEKPGSREAGGFRYMTLEKQPGFASTAAGVVALYCAGLYKDPAVEDGLKFLMQFKPKQYFSRPDFYYFYGHYYAAQAMWTAGGTYWSEWYPAIRDELISRAQRGRHEGVWVDQICPHYATAMACIILQIPNNYLPILQK
jgi:hypothetical protein